MVYVNQVRVYICTGLILVIFTDSSPVTCKYLILYVLYERVCTWTCALLIVVDLIFM